MLAMHSARPNRSVFTSFSSKDIDCPISDQPKKKTTHTCGLRSRARRTSSSVAKSDLRAWLTRRASQRARATGRANQRRSSPPIPRSAGSRRERVSPPPALTHTHARAHTRAQELFIRGPRENNGEGGERADERTDGPSTESRFRVSEEEAAC